MGIKLFTRNLKRQHPELFRQCRLSKFKGHKIGMDVSIWFYAFKNTAIKQALYSTDLTKEELNYDIVTSFWLQKFHDQAMMMIEVGSMPVPVFDGPHLRLKKGTKQDRKDKLDGLKENIDSFKEQISSGEYDQGIVEDLKSHLSVALWVTQEEIEALKRMYDDMGVFYIQADTEAERYLAELCKQKYISAVYTRDSDAFAYKTPIVITDLERKTRLGKPLHNCTYVIFENLLRALELTEEAFVDFCIMCGTDYNSNLAVLNKNIKIKTDPTKYRPYSYGYSKCLKLIKDHDSIENCIKEIGKKGYVIGFEQAKEFLTEHGPIAKTIINKMRRKGKLPKSDITYEEVRDEIRGYFLIPPKIELERELVHFVSGNMKTCFSEILFGPNRERMLQDADSITQKLLEFESKFLSFQTYILEVC